jgi:peroxiredoxin
LKKTKKSKYLISSLLMVFAGVFALSVVVFSGCCIPINSLISSSESGTSVSEETTTSASETIQETSNQETVTDTEESVTEESSDTSETQSEKDTSGYANNFSFYDLDNNKISFSDYAGKILVLNFWATWCSPCSEEIPDFAATYSEYKDKGVEFLGISDDNIDSLNNYYKVSSINYPTVIDGSIDQIIPSWGIDAIPHTFILNGKGEIIFDQLGQMAKEDLVNAIENALQQQ